MWNLKNIFLRTAPSGGVCIVSALEHQNDYITRCRHMLIISTFYSVKLEDNFDFREFMSTVLVSIVRVVQGHPNLSANILKIT